MRAGKKRFFVLRDDKLIYFSDDTLATVIGAIGLDGASVRLVLDSKKPGVFQVRTPGRDFELQAASGDAATEWLAEIERAIVYANARQRVSTVGALTAKAEPMEGTLLRPSGTKWKECFVALRGGMLRVTQDEQSSGALAKLALYGAKYGRLNIERPPPNIAFASLKERALSGNDALGALTDFSNCFFVTAQGSARSVVLKCYSSKSFDEWQRALERHRSSVETTVNRM